MYRQFYFSCLFGLLITHSLPAGLSSNPLLSLNPSKWFGQHQKANDPTDADRTLEIAEKKFIIAEKNYEKQKSGTAKRLLKRIITRYPNLSVTAKALALRAQIYRENQHWIKCFNDLQQIVEKYPLYKDFDNVISTQFDCATALMEGARGRIFWIFPGFKQHATSVALFEQIVNNAPYNDIAPIALMNIALVSEKTDNTEAAIDALDRLINYYPQSVLAPEAYYNLAKIYSDLVKGHEYDQGSTRRAISYYEDFLVLFPNSDYAGEVEAELKKMENLLAKSRLDLGDFYYYYRYNTTAALVFYNETITIEPNSDSAEEARLRIEDIQRGVRPISNASLIRKLLGAR